jgi:hypothetical protein
MKQIVRSAFLYISGKAKDFAQCSSCCLNDDGKCVILDIAIDPNDTCGLYIPGWYAAMTSKKRVTPEEAGLLRDTKVRCENCRHSDEDIDEELYCELFEKLNQELPELFDLDTEIEPRGCCNAWQSK